MDIFVGVLSGLLGLGLISGAALDAAWLMQLGRPQLLVRAFGRPMARALLALLGAGLVALGIAVAIGWRPSWAN
jgi:hypothetical protein